MAFNYQIADQIGSTRDSYNRGIKRNIKENARISRDKKFREEVSDAQEIIFFLDPYGTHGSLEGNGFLSKMAWALEEWGSLTENQLAPVRKAMAKAKERNAEFEKMKAERAAKSNYVGTVGVRQEFVLKVVYVHAFEGIYGWSYINICHDADENVVVYKGTQDWGKDSEVTCMAKIKNHDVREGEKQTIIQRPTKVTINGEAY
tara:strand:+ start:40 stop:648 length:609 start_codon:yes stop_codon:yes gene_type:complete